SFHVFSAGWWLISKVRRLDETSVIVFDILPQLLEVLLILRARIISFPPGGLFFRIIEFIYFPITQSQQGSEVITRRVPLATYPSPRPVNPCFFPFKR